mgnify:FL=1
MKGNPIQRNFFQRVLGLGKKSKRPRQAGASLHQATGAGGFVGDVGTTPPTQGAGSFVSAFGMKSPAKQKNSPLEIPVRPRKESLNPIGPYDKEGYFETIKNDVSTKTSMPDLKGDTTVITTTSNRYTDPETGKVYSKVRGPSPEIVEEISVIGPEGEEKGKTKIVGSNPVSGDDFMAGTKYVDKSNPFSGPRKWDPETRSFKM